MSRTKITGIECDRCGEGIQTEETGRPDVRIADWGRVFAADLAGADRVGTSELPADLCGGCMDDLVRFMDGCSLVAMDIAEAAGIAS